MSDEGKKEKQINVNTLLLAIIMAVLTYVGKTTVESSNAIARIDAILGTRLASGDRMESKLDALSKDVSNQRETINELRYAVDTLKKTTKP